MEDTQCLNKFLKSNSPIFVSIKQIKNLQNKWGKKKKTHWFHRWDIERKKYKKYGVPCPKRGFFHWHSWRLQAVVLPCNEMKWNQNHSKDKMHKEKRKTPTLWIRPSLITESLSFWNRLCKDSISLSETANRDSKQQNKSEEEMKWGMKEKRED